MQAVGGQKAAWCGRPCYKRWSDLLQEATGFGIRGELVLLPWRLLRRVAAMARRCCCHVVVALLHGACLVAAMALRHCAMELAGLLPCHGGNAARKGRQWYQRFAVVLQGGQQSCCKAERRCCCTGDVSSALSDDGCGRRRTDAGMHGWDVRYGERMMHRRPRVLRRRSRQDSPAMPAAGFSGDAPDGFSVDGHGKWEEQRRHGVGEREVGGGEHYVRGAVHLLLFESIFY
jgi:hypothetical protein